MHEQDSAWRREYAEQGQQPVSAGAPVSGGTASHGTAAPHGTAPSHGAANGSTTASLPATLYTSGFYNVNDTVAANNLTGLSDHMYPGSNVYDHWFGFQLMAEFSGEL